MRINALKANSVFGYLDINISFNKDFTFVVGGNGSGKTSAIRLLNAILTPSPKELNLIPFKEASVTLTNEDKQYTIKAKKENDHISISIPRHIKGTFKVPFLDIVELEYRYEERERGENYFKSYLLENRDNNILKFLLALPSPYFLGLDRKILGNDPFDTQSRQKRMITSRVRRASQYQRIITGNLGSGLIEVQELLFDVMSQIRKVTDRENEKQRNSLLRSSFKYTTFSDVVKQQFDFSMEEDLLKRRGELEETLKQMDMFKNEADSEISNFFKNLENLREKAKSIDDDKDRGLDAEWVINKAQITRIYDFLQIIDDTRNKINKISSKLNIFLDLVNTYYAESQKRLYIDPIGNASLRRPKGGSAGLDALSSGEKQILIIFANSILRSGKDKVFIVDEPEISLHLNWQERLVDDIKNLDTGSQYIFATHSPEIIAGYEGKCMEVS